MALEIRGIRDIRSGDVDIGRRYGRAEPQGQLGPGARASVTLHLIRHPLPPWTLDDTKPTGVPPGASE